MWDGEIFWTRAYNRREFGGGTFSAAAISSAPARRQIRRFLNSARTPVILTNHHLGRFAESVTTPFIIVVHDLIRAEDLARGGVSRTTRMSDRDAEGIAGDLRGIARASGVVVPSEQTRDQMCRLLPDYSGEIRVIPVPVGAHYFDPPGGTAETLTRGSSPYLLYVGTEQPRKNISTLLKALQRVRGDGIDLHLVKVGTSGSKDGAYRKQTLAMVRELKLDPYVTILEGVPDSQMVQLYAGAVALALPSLSEGFGLPVAEALVVGTPPIISADSPMAAFSGSAGVVVDPSSIADLSQAISNLATDEHYRSGFATSPDRRIERFHPAYHNAQLVEFMEKLS
ncbi:glycosyltransferase family 4 protein [Streptomyces sp. NPDC058286]|uniref:glycosyltransferase family 4 protein n=1 Tax=Streptomyces sp. NPDC058286 TaxID=3346422 RepID=UPI0036EBD2AC